MSTETKKRLPARLAIYFCGITVLVMGLTLNSKTGLGLNPMISMAYASARATGMSFSVCTFIMYVVFLAIQLAVLRNQAGIREFLQLPFAFVFSLLLDVFDKNVQLHFDCLALNVAMLLIAVCCVGVGMSMTMNMRIVVNPADGLVQNLSRAFKIEPGLMKNILDGICVCISCAIDLCFNTLFTSIGLGTVISMVVVGRVMHLFNRLFLKKMQKAAGLDEQAQG